MRHEAINNLYSNVASQTNNLAFDAKGNSIVIDEAKVAEEVKRLEAEYDSKKYQRDRLAEYPSIQELVVALYDSDDKAEIDKKRAEINKKFPKQE